MQALGAPLVRREVKPLHALAVVDHARESMKPQDVVGRDVLVAA